MPLPPIRPSSRLDGVEYEIRGPLARRAHELERQGYDILKLNIGNPGAFGLRPPETLRLALIENLAQAEAYAHEKGIFPAREAVVMQQQSRGIDGVTVDDVFIGNGVSELIMMAMGALLEVGDEVLVPSPDYPLWTAAVAVHGGKPVHYACRPEAGFVPDVDELRSLVTDRTRAIVSINPNNPTGAVYPRAVLEQIADLAEERGLIVFSDEIYDRILYDGAEFVPMAELARKTLCVTFAGLSKVYRACGLRVGWAVFSGERRHARQYIEGIEFLASLRLCANVPGQWAVQTALGGFQSIQTLCSPGGRLYESRAVTLECVERSPFLWLEPPMGAMYAFVGIDRKRVPHLSDRQFAQLLLEKHHILVVPGSSFNFDRDNHFRITFLPEARDLRRAFSAMETLLAEHAA